MYKRKAVVRAENGYLHCIADSIVDDFETSKHKFYYSSDLDDMELTVYCVGETYLKPKIDEFCKWIEEHYNER